MGYKHLMLVEGKDDQHVVGYLLEHYGIDCAPAKIIPFCYDNKIIIDEKGGIDRLLLSLPIILDDGDIQRLAIMLDADTDVKSRWQSLCDILNQSGDVKLPNVPDPLGTTVILHQEGRQLVVGIWIMPDNQIPGILEDFIRWLIPENDDLWPDALQTVAKINESKRRFPIVRKSKAEIHTWLAWQKEPGKSLGTAISAKYLNPTVKQSSMFIDWIRKTFEIE